VNYFNISDSLGFQFLYGSGSCLYYTICEYGCIAVVDPAVKGEHWIGSLNFTMDRSNEQTEIHFHALQCIATYQEFPEDQRR
jgi:hypothetical protein